MNQSFQISNPQKQQSSTDIKQLSLYASSRFDLPTSPPLILSPFESQETLPSKPFEQLIPFKTYQYTYNAQYQAIMNNIKYVPVCIAANEKYIVVATKAEFLIFDNIKNFNSYKKITIQDTITCLDIREDGLLVGTKSGKILYYFLNKKAIACEINYLKSNVTTIKLISPSRLSAIDCLGNFIFFDVNIKIIMEKVFVLNTNFIPIYEEKQTKTFSKLWKNFVSKEASSETAQLNYYYSTFAVMGQRCKQYLLKNEMITAVCRKNQIKILLLNQDKLDIKDQQLLFEIKAEVEVGIFTFGMSEFDYPNQSNLLFVVSIGTLIHYFKLVRTDYNHSWYQVFKVQSQNQIYDGLFISNNLIAYITESGLQISNIGDQLQLVTEINCKVLLQINTQKNKYQIYKNLLGCSWDKSMFFCLQERKIIIGEVQTWQNYLKPFTYDFKSEDAMSYAMMIYNGKITKLAGIKQNISQRNQEMRTYFSNIALTYLNFEIKNNPDQIQRTMIKCCQFMMDTLNHEYLFSTMYDSIFSNVKYKRLFFIVLEDFIKMRKVRLINKRVLLDCIEIYRQLNKINSIQTLIINLDFNMVDKSFIFEICLQYQLYKSLIHLSLIQEYFITPVIKICGKISMEPQINIQEIKRGQIIFWYIKNCLNGTYVQIMNQAKFMQMLEKLITYIFIPVTLKTMCKTNPEYYFRVIQLFFDLKVLKLILQNSEKLIIKKHSFTNKKIFEKQGRAQFHVYQQILKIIIFTDYFFTEITEYYLNKFLTLIILKNHFPFDQSYKIRVAKFFIQNPKVFHNRVVITEEEEEVINSYLIRIFDYIFCKCTQKRTQELFLMFTGIIEASKHRQLFSESLCYLHHLNRDFKKCFEIYFEMKNQFIKNKIIQYVESNIYLKDIHSEILDNIISLISINKSRVLNLLAANLEEDAQIILEKLKEFPNLQLKFLEIILNTKPHPSDQLKISHLKIAIVYDANSVEKFLKKIDYPLKEAQKICQQYNHRPGIARLICKRGDIEQGILKMVQIFYESFDMIYNNPNENENQNEKINLYQRLNQILQICMNEHKKDQQRGQQIWQICIQAIFKNNNLIEILSEKTLHHNQYIKQIIKKVLFTLCSQISTQFFIEKLILSLKYLTLNIFNESFFKLFSRIFYARTLFKYTRDLFQQNVLRETKLVYQIYTKSILINICSSCNQQILHDFDEKILVFRCGHIFHNRCNQTGDCILCEKNTFFINFIEEKNQQVPQKVPQKEKGIIKQISFTKKQRLKLFDVSLNKIDANIDIYLKGQLPSEQQIQDTSSLLQAQSKQIYEQLNINTNNLDINPQKIILILDQQDINPIEQQMIIILDSIQKEDDTK